MKNQKSIQKFFFFCLILMTFSEAKGAIVSSIKLQKGKELSTTKNFSTFACYVFGSVTENIFTILLICFDFIHLYVLN